MRHPNGLSKIEHFQAFIDVFVGKRDNEQDKGFNFFLLAYFIRFKMLIMQDTITLPGM